MNSHELKLKELSKSVERYERKTRSRSLIYSLFIPSIFLTIYLFFLGNQVVSLNSRKKNLKQEISSLAIERDEVRRERDEVRQELNNARQSFGEFSKVTEEINKSLKEGSIEKAKEQTTTLIKNQASFERNSLESYFESNKLVSFTNKRNLESGRVTKVEVRDNSKPDESGVIIYTKLNQNDHYHILLLKDNKSRIWYRGQELGGTWMWDSNKGVTVNLSDNRGRFNFSSNPT